ncbi:MAG: WGR domain-containing protein [Myxococcota bacterium]
MATPKPKAKASKAPAKKKPTPAPKKAAAAKAAKPAAAPKAAKPAPAPKAAKPAKPAPASKGGKLVLGKLPPGTYPERSGPDDFQCFGPPAMKDGDFDKSRVCDMGCFTQDGKDSNKYYHGAVVQHRGSKNWYAYFEWGRTGAKNPSFLFVGCRDEAHAAREYASQLHSKNTKRGEWVTIAGIQTLRAKKGQDCYLVRPQATRSTGLPDARTIEAKDGAKKPAAAPAAGKTAKKKGPDIDPQTLSLMKDLSLATVAYTRGSMADASLPTQTAIEEARSILSEAQNRLKVVGETEKALLKDKQLMTLTTLMYGRIPKKKPVGADVSTWLLSKDNILLWQHDLDAFESALYVADADQTEFDPFADMKLDMSWIAPTSDVGKFLHDWWPKATNNRHGHLGKLKIKNLWRVDRHADQGKIPEAQKSILAGKPKIAERPLFQRKDRPDLPAADAKRYQDSNTGLLFHGTRSVNVSGILREALRLPKQLVGVTITGAMFGPGIYFADDWKKSAGYTSLSNSYWSNGSGSVAGRGAFMFACDVVLGAPFVAPRARGYTSPPDGHHCIFGKAQASGVANNEFIVFDTKQAKLQYLAEFATS